MPNQNNQNQSTTKVDAPAIVSSLPIPLLLEGRELLGVQHYDLTLQESQHQFFENIQTKTYGINSSYLGPTLLLKNGEDVSINISNNLKETTTIHGHGMHLPAAMDGGPHQLIPVNSTWSAQYRVNQKACTNWYHPHLMGKTAEHVYKGLAGLIIVEDSDSQSLDLPKRYGEDDIPLVLQDRVFDSSGEIDYTPSRQEIMRGYIGDIFLTNGAVAPTISLEAKEIRFRILNGSNASVYTLGFDDNRTFKQIATDNAFLTSPVSLTRLRLSPGERAEIVVDLSADEGESVLFKEFNKNKTFLNINSITAAALQTITPNVLTSLEVFNPDSAQNIRSFVLSGRMGDLNINGVSMDLNVINEQIPIDQVEIWEVTNSMMMSHNFHIHATHFMILERNGSSANVAENEKGYKDTVYIPPNERVKLIVKMVDYKDQNNPYMYHCHFLEHEDAGMMGQFVVV
jgi:FtsP/CotA-like multicopper oxidase with cupredoxin domain